MCKVKSLIVILVIYFVYTCNVFSQESGGIKGVVKDSVTGETIPFANIKVIGQNIGTQANGSGIFVLKGIFSGKSKIQLSAIGYQKITKEIFLNPGDFLYFTVFLVQDIVELDEVTSEIDRYNSTYLTNISVQSINTKEFKSIPLAIERDVMKTLKVLPGVNAASDITGQLFIRGGAADQNLVFCDNLKIANPFHAMGLFGIFSEDIVKSSDVITGGFDPEYGGKLSSVIKINTRNGDKDRHHIKINAGILAGNATFDGPLFGGTYLFSYRRSYFNGILNKILDDEISLSFDDLFGKYTAAFGSEGNISFSILTSGDDIKRKNDDDPSYKWRTFAMGFTFQSFLSKLLLSWTTSYSSYRMEENYLPSYGENSNSTYSSLSINTKAEYQFENNDILSGGFDMDVFSTKNHFKNSYDYMLASGDNVPVVSVYLKYNFTPIRNFRIETGIRQNKIGFDNQNLNLFEPRVNMIYNLTSDLSIKASATRMHQYIISNIDESDFIPLFEAWIPLKNQSSSSTLTSYSLFPEKASQYVIGIDTRIFNKAKLVIQGYYKNIKNFIGYNSYRKSSSDAEYSSGKGECKGIETFLKFENKVCSGMLTYNWSWVGKETENISYPPRYDKRHNLSIVTGYELPMGIKMGLNWDFSSGMPFTPLVYFWELPSNGNIPYTEGFPSYSEYVKNGAINSRRLPCYHKLDISLTRDFRVASFVKTEICLNFSNVYNRANIFYYNRRSGKRVNMMPFMITGSISVKI